MIKEIKYGTLSANVHIKDPNEHIQKHWMLGNFYEASRNGVLNHIFLNQKVGKWIDIGASIGNHTLFFAAMGADVVAIEPYLPSFEHLKDNIICNDFDVQISTHNVALGNKRGKISMQPMSEINCGMNQVREGGDIPMVTIDEMSKWFKGYDMLKIDVEHYNRQLIEGGIKTLTEGRGNIYIEAESEAERDEVDELLGLCGYTRVDGLVFNHTPTYLYTK